MILGNFSWDKFEENLQQNGVNTNLNQVSNSNSTINKSKRYILEVIFWSKDKGHKNPSESLFQKSEDEVALTKFISHCQIFIKKQQLSLNSLAEDGTLLIKDVVGPYKQSQEPLILPQLEPYQILPSDVDLKFCDDTNEPIPPNEYDKILASLNLNTLQIKSKSIIGTNSRMNSIQSTLNDKIPRTRLKKMLKFFIGKHIPHYSIKDIDEFKQSLQINCVGIDYYAELIHKELARTLTSPIYNKPKGILFYGPPRTGKTHISLETIKYLNFFRICEDLAAGDFCKPLVGQSEQMINCIAARCDVLPWELCIMFIDEIDSLCPNRNSSNASSGKNDLLGVFLALMDGNKKKKNLLIIGTSNRLKQMDLAFLQRMDIKLFIGLPNSLSRADWVQRMVAKTKGDLASPDYLPGIKPEYIEAVKSCMTSKKVLDTIQHFTINFTADAMQKSISQVMTDLVNFDKYYKCQKEELEQLIIEVVFDNLHRICINDKIYISNETPPSLVQDIDNFCKKEQFNDENWRDDWWFCLTPQKSRNYSKRMLIDLKEAQDEQFQIEINGKIETTESQYNLMCEIIHLVKNTQGVNTLEHVDDQLKNLFKRFIKEFDFYAKMLKQKNVTEIEKDSWTILRFFTYFVKQGYQNLISDTRKSILFGLAKDGLKSRDDALKVLVKMGQSANMNYIAVIDAAYFIKLGIMRDEVIAEEIIMVCEEAIQYDCCLVIFDLDSIADVTKEFNELHEDILTSSEKAFQAGKNDAGFTYVINRKQAFRATLECLKVGPSSTKNHWFVAISDNNKLTLDFKEKLKWPPSQQQLLQEQNILSHNDNQRCVYCLEFFTEKTNEHNSCGRHLSNYLYDQDFITKTIEIKREQNKSYYDPFQDKKLNKSLYMKSAKEVRKMMNSKNEADIKKAGSYVWYCCGKKLYEKGESKEKHSTQFI